MTAQNVLDRLDHLEDVVVDGLPVDPGGGGGTTTTTTDTVVATTGEPSIALQNAITAGGVAGASIVLAPGVHNWTTIPTIPPGITGRLRIMGAPGAVVRLSAIAPRFIDFGKTADYDEFRNIELRDLLIDANSVGGRHHVVIGTYQAGTPQTRISVKNLQIENVRTINVPVDSALVNHRLNVWIVPGTPTGTTAMHLSNIRVNNVRFEGGNQGVVIAAADLAGGSACLVDEVHVSNWWHSRLTVHGGPLAFSSSNVQIGSRATVGRVSITDGYGEFSGDVGIELDSAQNATIRNVKIVDAFNIAFLLVNFVTPPSAMAQDWVLTECVGLRQTATNGVGFRIDNNGGGAFGNITLNDCSWHHTQGGVASSGADGILCTQTVDFNSITVNGFDYVRENFTYTSATNALVDCVAINGISTSRSPHVTLRDVRIRVVGTRDSGTAGTLQLNGIELAGSTFSFLIENPYFHVDIANMSNTGTRLVEIGRESSNLRGTIRGVRLGTISDDVNPRGVLIRGTSTLTIPNRILVEDCDFVRMPSGAAELAYVSPSNVARVVLKGIKWRRELGQVAEGTVTVSSSPVTYQNLSGYRERVIIEGGVLNSTEYGREFAPSTSPGTVTYRDVSGAAVYLVDPGDYLRVTYQNAPTAIRRHEAVG